MTTKAEIEDRFGKGPEHEEIRTMFAEFAWEIAKRVPDGPLLNSALSALDQAAVHIHTALSMAYPTSTDLKPLAKESLAKVDWDKAKIQYNKYNNDDTEAEWLGWPTIPQPIDEKTP